MLLISIAKALIEMAGMCVTAHMLVGMFSPSTRHDNAIYRLFGVLVKPIYRAVRRIMPTVVLNEHIPIASLLTLVILWLIALYLKIQAAGLSI